MTPKKTPRDAGPLPAVAAPDAAPTQNTFTERALFVSLANTYRELAPLNPGFDSDNLRTSTLFAWHIVPESAAGVKWIVGIFRGRPVSIYRVETPSTDWPVMPASCVEVGRRVVPADVGVERHFSDLGQLAGKLSMNAVVRYGKVQRDASGTIVGVWLGR